jgi:hypothetical protein
VVEARKAVPPLGRVGADLQHAVLLRYELLDGAASPCARAW